MPLRDYTAVLNELRRVRRAREELMARECALALEARLVGMPYRTIGPELGLGHETVRRMVVRALAEDDASRMASDG